MLWSHFGLDTHTKMMSIEVCKFLSEIQPMAEILKTSYDNLNIIRNSGVH
jgi:hypothetical protein